MPLQGESTNRVYLDHAATVPLMDGVEEILKTCPDGNASALHEAGRVAARALEDARRRIARLLGAHDPSEIIFTSGGTEADNLAIQGIMRRTSGGKNPHLVVSAVEHHAVLESASALRASGCLIDVLEVDESGLVDAERLEELLRTIDDRGEHVALVAVQAVNNEVGSIQSVADLAAVAHAHGALFFCDAVQALGKIDIRLEESGIDAAAFSAHKIGGLKGIGALYLRRGVSCAPVIHGGGQERGMRSGTSNVFGACVFATALEHAVENRERNWQHAKMLRSHLLDELESSQEAAAHHLRPTLPSMARSVPHILSLVCDGLEGETLVLRFDDEGIAVSSGSACSSRSLDPSHVLLALGLSKRNAYGGLRISFGEETCASDIDRFCFVLQEVLR